MKTDFLQGIIILDNEPRFSQQLRMRRFRQFIRQHYRSFTGRAGTLKNRSQRVQGSVLADQRYEAELADLLKRFKQRS